MKHSIFLGIDFGTTNSSASYILPDPRNTQASTIPVNSVEFIQDDEGEDIKAKRIPSIVAIQKNSRSQKVLTGWEAYHLVQKGLNNGPMRKGINLFLSTKSDLTCGVIYPFSAKKDLIQPKDFVKLILKKILDEAEKTIPNFDLANCKITLTVPASLGYDARKKTINALEALGVNHESIDLIDEPNAALLDFLNDQSAGTVLSDSNPRHILVFDYGGGTLDLCLLKAQLSANQALGISVIPLAISSYNQNGGDQIDKAIMEKVIWPALNETEGIQKAQLNETEIHKIENVLTFCVARKLKEKLCEKIQREFSEDPFSAPDNLSVTHRFTAKHGIEAIGKDLKTNFKLTKKEFDTVLEPFFDSDVLKSEETNEESIFNPIADCCHKAGINPEDIDIILLNGGSCKNPYIKARLYESLAGLSNQKFSNQILPAPDLTNSVSRGAALFGYWKHERNKKILQDIAAEQFGILDKEGLPHVLIEAGDPIPFPERGEIELEQQFVISRDNQKNLLIPFFVGMNNGPQHYSRSIKFLLPEQARKGTPLKIKYKIDTNKVLHWFIKVGALKYERLEPIMDPWNQSKNVKNLDKISKCVNAVIESLDGDAGVKLEHVFQFARALYNGGQEKSAEVLLLDLLENKYNNQSVHNLLSLIYNNSSLKNKKERADFHYRRSIEINPDNGILIGNYALFLMEQNKTEEGLSMMRLALSKDPDLAYIYRALGDYKLKMGQHEEAIKEYQQAIRVLENPKSQLETAPYGQLSILYRLIGNYQKADELALRQREQDESNAVGGNPEDIIAAL